MDDILVTGINARTASAEADAIGIEIRVAGPAATARLRMSLLQAEQLIAVLQDQRAASHRIRNQHGDAPGTLSLTSEPEVLESHQVMIGADMQTGFVRLSTAKKEEVLAMPITTLEALGRAIGQAIRAFQKASKRKN